MTSQDGAAVWVPDKEELWLKGDVVSISGSDATVKLEGGESRTFSIEKALKEIGTAVVQVRDHRASALVAAGVLSRADDAVPKHSAQQSQEAGGSGSSGSVCRTYVVGEEADASCDLYK